MNQRQFQKACDLAFSDVSLLHVDDSLLSGYGLPDFKPVCVTLEAAARTIRWQCQMMSGEVSQEGLDECRKGFGRKVQIVEI